MVHSNYLLTLTAVRLGSSVLHVPDSVSSRNDVGQLEECRLQKSVDSRAQTDFLTDLNTIDGVELDIVAGNVSLNRTRQSLVQLVQIPTAVQQEGTAGLQSSSHVILVHIRGVVAGYEVSLLNQVGALDRLLTESQVRGGNTAGLLRVKLK